MEQKKFEIISNNKIAANTFEMVLATLEGGHGTNKSGQFVNIKLDGFFLRRPISVCCCRDDRTIVIIYKAVGEGTKAMSYYESGKTLDILTGLGNGFRVPESWGKTPLDQVPVLIGGGAGVPPMYGLCRELLDKGISPIVVLGFNSKDEAFYLNKFKELGVDVLVSTVDGSLGVRGFVTDVIKNIFYTYFYACGPEAMLLALDMGIDKRVEGQMSFEERMGCGFGACMGCSCKTKYGNKRICKEGPVLERREIIW